MRGRQRLLRGIARRALGLVPIWKSGPILLSIKYPVKTLIVRIVDGFPYNIDLCIESISLYLAHLSCNWPNCVTLSIFETKLCEHLLALVYTATE